jgi:hypothetical protein
MEKRDRPAIGKRLPSEIATGADVSHLIGATIVSFGSARFDGRNVLAIEYERDGKRGRDYFAYSELGIWPV